MPSKKTNKNSKPRTSQKLSSKSAPLVSIVMGSQSDYETLQHTEQVMIDFSIPYEIQVVSAHRTPTLMYKFAQAASQRNIKVIIAGAGGSAHLPGMISSLTTIPVLGIPVESKTLKGLDSLLSIVQMPAGVPTATFAIGTAGATNAGLFALKILSLQDKTLAKKLTDLRLLNSKKALAGNKTVQQRYREKKK
jgi:5-(carboxyamino)imidazole ribonucleotide mutase